MFGIEPTSAELASSRKHFAKRPFLQWNAQLFRTPPCGSAGHSRHERPTTHIPAPEGLPRKTAAAIHSRMAGCRSPPKVRQPTIFESSTLVQQTTLQRSSSTRVHAQSLSHNVGSSRRIQKPPCTKKSRAIHVRALTTRTHHTQGRFPTAICIRCCPPNTWQVKEVKGGREEERGGEREGRRERGREGGGAREEEE